jgi:hypothetical protein
VIGLCTGQPSSTRDRTVARVLGSRHLVQAVVTARAPNALVLSVGAQVDLAHAASMLALGAVSRPGRRAPLADGLIAVIFAVLGAANSATRRPGLVCAALSGGAKGEYLPHNERKHHVYRYRDRCRHRDHRHYRPGPAEVARQQFRTPSSAEGGYPMRTRQTGNDALVGIDQMVRNVETGRFERSLSALTAAGALVTAAEIYFEHDSASFGNKMMWVPVVLGPVGAVAGVAGFCSRRMAKTALPITSAAIVANGLQGLYLHGRGIARKPGGWSNARYNMEMGPPLLAPLLVTMVGGMGLLAAILRREK